VSRQLRNFLSGALEACKASASKLMRSDALEKLARAERKKLIDTAIATGTVEEEALDYVDRLSKVAADARPSRSWLIPAIALILFTVFLGLLVKEQHETQIELDLVATELSFRIPKPQSLADAQFLRSLSASALNGIEVDGVDWPAPNGSTCSLRADLLQPAQKEEAITLSSLAPPGNWEVAISRAGSGTDFELTAPMPTGEDFFVGAVLRGKAILLSDCTSDGTKRHVDWNGPGSLIMRIGTGTTLHGESDVPVKFVPQIEFENLRLYAIERIQVDSAPIDRLRSALSSGTVYLDALNAKAVALRPFEDLTFGSSKGYIRAISFPTDSKLTGDGLHLQAHAVVQNLNLGSGVNKRSLMPSWLEVLAARTGIALLWASVTYFLGITYAALRWFEVIN
jgi:hypothetical protein